MIETLWVHVKIKKDSSLISNSFQNEESLVVFKLNFKLLNHSIFQS